jgi:hypothetical protein
MIGTRGRLAALVAGLAVLAVGAFGQPPKKSDGKGAGKGDALARFLDKARPVAARKQAGMKIGVVTRDQAPKLRAVRNDKSAPDDLRVIALRKMPSQERATTIKDVLAILKTSKNGGEVFRSACVTYLHRQAEFTAEGRKMRADVVAAVRPLLPSKHEGVRKRALAFLMHLSDPTAVRFLSAVLDGKEKAITKTEAIRFLAQNPARHKGVLQKGLADKDPKVRAEAIRVLGHVPGAAVRSSPALLKQMRDSSQPPELRLAILASRIQNPTDAVIEEALALLKDPKAGAAVRAGCIRELGKVANQEKFRTEQSRKRVLEAIKGLEKDPSPEVKKVAAQYVQLFSKSRKPAS